MSHAPYSFSKIETFDCGFRYDQKYNRKQKEAETAPLAFGSAFHEFAARYTQSCAENRLPADIDLARAALKHVLASTESKLTQEQVEELTELAMEWAERRQVPFEATIRTEVEFAVTKDGALRGWWDPDVWFRARMDELILDRRAPHPLVIRDLKTNQALPAEGDRRLRFQLNLYARLGFFLMPDLREILVEAEFVRHGVIRRRIVTREEADATLEQAEKRMISIESTTEWNAQPGSSCGICGFKEICPALNVNGGPPIPGIVNQEQAQKAAAELTALEARRDELRKHLNAWVKGAGPVTVGDMEWGFHTSRRTKYVNARELAELVLKRKSLDVFSVDTGRLNRAVAKDPELAEIVVPYAYDASQSEFGQRIIEGSGQ